MKPCCFESKDECYLQSHSRGIHSHRVVLDEWDLSKLRAISHRNVCYTNLLCTDGRGFDDDARRRGRDMNKSRLHQRTI